MAVSQIRQNFHEDTEKGINKQINMELYASYVYLTLSYHFDRDDVALKGISEYFRKASDEEREHAQKFMKYLNKRGGRIVLDDIKALDKQTWTTVEEAFQDALKLEKDVNQSLLNLHFTASEKHDANFCDFLENEFLQEQVDSIKSIGDYITNIRRVGEGLGIFIFDKELSS
uniref:Ferritin n=1 Tax=Clastoptera arizonana TaxID=38151 RepID=A0A1B6D9R2_9HEMI